MRRPALWDDQPSVAKPCRATAPRTVVVGYDGSETAQRALLRAAEAAGSGGDVVVVTAAQPANPLVTALGAGSPVEEPSRLLEKAAALLKGHDVRVSTRAEEAEPVEALADVARELNAALIVVGARGENYLARALRGSVAERLIARTPCDLLVAR
jgi:nucleotide-binding universal stress UspA family protein